MGIWIRRFGRKTALTVGPLVASAALSISLGAATSGAAKMTSASPSAFCHTIMSINIKSPAMTSYKTYRAWAVAYLPTYEKLAAQAPNASVKRILDRVVAMMKASANLTNFKTFASYIATHRAEWSSDWLALTKAIGVCISSIGTATG